MKTFVFRISRLVTVCTTPYMIGAILAACSGTDGSSSSPGGTTSASSTDAGGAGSTADGGRTLPEGGADAGRSSDGGTTDPFGGPETCGNGIDDDGNGLVDDGCTVAACNVGTIAEFDLPNEHTYSGENFHPELFAFDHAHGQVLAIARFDEYLRAYSDATGALTATAATVTGNAGNGFMITKSGYVTLGPAPATVLDPALQHASALTGGCIDCISSGGGIYEGVRINQIPTPKTAEYRTFDAMLVPASPMNLEFATPPYNTNVRDLAGEAVWENIDVEYQDGFGDVSTVQLEALGPAGMKWASDPITDPWSGYYGMTATPPARAADRILFCQGGALSPINSGYQAKNSHYDCHILDAKIGSHLKDLSSDFENVDINGVGVVSFADGWLVLRFDRLQGGSAVNPMRLRMDHVSLDGAVETDVLDTTEAANTDIIDVKELSPTEFAILYSKGDATARVGIYGCK